MVVRSGNCHPSVNILVQGIDASLLNVTEPGDEHKLYDSGRCLGGNDGRIDTDYRISGDGLRVIFTALQNSIIIKEHQMVISTKIHIAEILFTESGEN